MEFQGGLNALVVRDLVAVPRAQDDFPERHVANEHLVEVAALAVGLSAGVDCRSETEVPQLLDDIRHVVIEVTTHDNRSAGVLSNDVPNDIHDPHCPFFEVLLVPWLQVTVEDLNIYVTQL